MWLPQGTTHGTAHQLLQEPTHQAAQGCEQVITSVCPGLMHQDVPLDSLEDFTLACQEGRYLCK